MVPCLNELQLHRFWELATHSGLALSRLTKHKQDKTKAKYDHEAQTSRSSAALMVQKSKTNEHKQAGVIFPLALSV